MLEMTILTYLAFCHCAQRLDHAQFDLFIWYAIQETHGHLHHLCKGLLELSMLLAEQQHLLVQ